MTVDVLLAVYDQQMRGLQPRPPAGVTYERDGPLLRAVGGHRGYISGPRDVGVTGAELDRLIARQRDYFAGRGEAVGWQTRAHDEPADLPARLRAAGFVPGQTDTVLIGLTAELATASDAMAGPDTVSSACRRTWPCPCDDPVRRAGTSVRE